MYYEKICNVALVVTSIVVFFIWQFVNTINFPDYFYPQIQPMIKTFINLIFAYGFFNSFIFLFKKLLEALTPIKKIIYGESYIEGTWIGYYFVENNVFLIYAKIQQAIGGININGKAVYMDKKTTRCLWNSSSYVTIDRPNNKVSFMYEVQSMDDNGIYKGIFELDLEEKRGLLNNPFRMHGYAFNLHSKQKIEIKLERLGKSNSKNKNGHDEEILFNKVLEIYEKDIKK
jgi:hypothetical protein